jgi:hypothetical protein
MITYSPLLIKVVEMPACLGDSQGHKMREQNQDSKLDILALFCGSL